MTGKSAPCLIAVLLCYMLASACAIAPSDSPSAAKMSYPEFYSASKTLSDGAVIDVEGVFDLKSICMNVRRDPQYRMCEAAFSEHARGATDSVWVMLWVCNEDVVVSCIEPLPDNAPPEIINIRNKKGAAIERWGKTLVRIGVRKENGRTIGDVLQIF